MKRALLASLFVCSLGIACGETSAPATQQLDGSFALSSVNGHSLPDTEAILPQSGPDGPKGPPTVVLGVSGVLTLNSAAGTFAITMNASNGAQEWQLLKESGTYSRARAALMLSEPFPDHVANLTGQVDAQSITIHGVFHDYTFQR